MIAAEKTNLETEKIELEKTIEDHHDLVNEKHVTFQRIGSQNKLIEFSEQMIIVMVLCQECLQG